MVVAIKSLSGGQPTGITALATASFINTTASPNNVIAGSWPASTAPFALRKGKTAFVGFSDRVGAETHDGSHTFPPVIGFRLLFSRDARSVDVLLGRRAQHKLRLIQGLLIPWAA